MSEPKRISPMLDNFAMGEAFSDRNGIRCYPAMHNDTGDKYILKVISSPASETQLEAMMLSGAFSSKEDAVAYYRNITEEIENEAQVLKNLAQMEGYIPYEDSQIVPMDGDAGFDLYLLSQYRNTLQHKLRQGVMTHLSAVNLGLDLCTALAVCRKYGYLYVNLKPDNIYLSDEQSYRIGDIGFIKLSSLKYASLPERYRSAYTAPEISDAYATLNTTIDVYALGLILYQVYNDGMLPTASDGSIQGNFVPPAYADYEMSEIILKACAKDPENRWQDPVELGQALVLYMQRNGVNDTPISPVSENTDPETTEEDVPIVPLDTVSEGINPESITEAEIFTEDAEGNLTFLDDENTDETAPEQNAEEITYEELTGEVSEMLNQADDLLSHPTPDPVVQPEPIDVPIPEPLPVEEIAEESSETQPEETEEETNPEEVLPVSDEDNAEDEETDDTQEDADTPKKKSHWVRNTILGILILALLAGGVLFYTKYYLQPIESFVLEESEGTGMVVKVTGKIDERKLTVICSDTYGNQLTQPVVNGQAVFPSLAPNSAYTVKIVTDGFHKLTGNTYAVFTTPVQTDIVQFNAVTGSDDGTAVIGFAIEGPDAKEWNIRYSAADEEEKTVSFTGHMVTLSDLTIGKEYTITLSPQEELLTTGITEIKHTASRVVKAANLFITGLSNNTLSASWTAPKDTSIDSWTVRCYDGKDYDTTKVVNECAVTFENVDSAQDYTIEVTASGMSVSERVYAKANALVVQGLKAEIKNTSITVSWDKSSGAPSDGWVVRYSVDNSTVQELSCKDDNAVTISNIVPNASYFISVEATDATPVLGGKTILSTPESKGFSGYGVKASNMSFKMCIKPSEKNWDRHDLSSDDYTRSFSIGTKAGFLVKMDKKYNTSSDKITTLFVIRDESGNIVSTATSTKTWTKMWYQRYCELDIPALPSSAGNYSISIFFNGALAHTQSFTMK